MAKIPVTGQRWEARSGGGNKVERSPRRKQVASPGLGDRLQDAEGRGPSQVWASGFPHGTIVWSQEPGGTLGTIGQDSVNGDSGGWAVGRGSHPGGHGIQGKKIKARAGGTSRSSGEQGQRRYKG